MSDSINRLMRNLLIVFVIFVVSAASFEGFFVKWSFRDYDPIYSFEAMFDGTAHRPFVYRQLTISISKAITNSLSETQKHYISDKIGRNNFLAQKFNHVNIKQNFILEYYIVYFLSFVFLFASVFVWRRICSEVTGNYVAGTLGALTFTMIFPFLETNGGYFYDCSELLFFSIAVLLAIRGRWLALILLTPVAEYNKESFLFFVITLYPLLRQNLSLKKSALTIFVSVLIAGLVYLFDSSIYANNLGGKTEFHLRDNLICLLTILYFVGVVFLFVKLQPIKKMTAALIVFALIVLPVILRNFMINTTFFAPFEIHLSAGNRIGHTYSVISGEFDFWLHLIMIFWIARHTWSSLSDVWKTQAKLALAINVPLVALFGLIIELRNFSILYPIFIIMISLYLKNLIASD